MPASAVSLADAIRSYLFNAQLVTLPDGGMALILPEEARETPARLGLARGDGRRQRPDPASSFVVDVRQSMANGGGPACLRLRVVADPATVDPRFLVDEAKLDRIAALRRGATGPSGSRPTTSPIPALWAPDRGGATGAVRRTGLERASLESESPRDTVLSAIGRRASSMNNKIFST